MSIRRVTHLSILISTLIIADTGGSIADTTTLSSAMTVASTCSFSTTIPGTMAVVANNPNQLKTVNGSPAKVTVTYTSTPTVTIADPIISSPSGAAQPTSITATGTTSSGIAFTDNNGKSYTYLSGSSDTISISNTATWSSNVPSGTHTFTNTVTCQ